MKHHKLSISKTNGEWISIEERLSELNYENDLPGFLRNRINALIKKHNDCPSCVTPADGSSPITKRPYIYRTQLPELEQIAKKMNIDISTLIDKLIISPLIYDNSKRNSTI